MGPAGSRAGSAACQSLPGSPPSPVGPNSAPSVATFLPAPAGWPRRRTRWRSASRSRWSACAAPLASQRRWVLAEGAELLPGWELAALCCQRSWAAVFWTLPRAAPHTRRASPLSPPPSSPQVKEGEAFNRELQEQKRLAAIAEREAKEKERRCVPRFLFLLPCLLPFCVGVASWMCVGCCRGGAALIRQAPQNAAPPAPLPPLPLSSYLPLLPPQEAH